MNLCLRGVTLIACVVVSACGSRNNPSPAAPSTTVTPAGPTLQSVALRPTGVPPRWYTSGATNQTLAIGMFSDGTSQDITTSCTDWESDNTFVLTITNEGLLTARNSGSATITTTCQGVSARGLVRLDVMPTTLWTRSGTGAAAFVEVPLYVGRLRITGLSSGPTHFAVLADGLLLFGQNLLRNVPHTGTYVVRPVVIPPNPPGNFISVQVVDTRNTTAWTLTEVR